MGNIREMYKIAHAMNQIEMSLDRIDPTSRGTSKSMRAGLTTLRKRLVTLQKKLEVHGLELSDRNKAKMRSMTELVADGL